MDGTRPLYFSVSDEADGHTVTPAAVPLGLLKDFVKDVATFVRGDEKEVDAAELLVSIVEGSLALRSYEELPAELGIWDDIDQLSKGLLDDVDPRRAAIAEKWRMDAVKHPKRVFKVGSAANGPFVAINANTHFRRELRSNWVVVERYLAGVVEDWGGQKSSNIHLRLEDGSTLKIDATRDQIRDEERNFVYRAAVVRIELEEDLVSGEIRNPKLIAFAEYAPRFDEDEFAKATAAGRAAWGDVADSVEWVRGIRGGKE